MMCSEGPYAKRAPADWARIQKECPNIIRKVFDRNDNYISHNMVAMNNNKIVEPKASYFIDAENNKHPLYKFTYLL